MLMTIKKNNKNSYDNNTNKEFRKKKEEDTLLHLKTGSTRIGPNINSCVKVKLDDVIIAENWLRGIVYKKNTKL